MAANFIQEEELFNGSEQEEVQDVTTPVPDSTTVDNTEEVDVKEPVEELPEKYRGKTAIEIARMHQEAEKLIGRQANEVHEVRSLADQLLKQQLDSKAKEAKPIEESLEDDFFADPASAVNRQVEKHPAVLEAQRFAAEMRHAQTAQKLAERHPGYRELAISEPFVEWVKASPVRMTLYTKAETELDYDSANELLSTYKELKQIKQQNQVQQSANVESKAQEQAMKAATVDVGGAGESSRKVYRRADLIKLRMTDPDRYMQLSDEIMQAYAEGRVK
jgi:predicted RNA-binding protein YlqC (UPF0109 family)